MRRTTLFLLAFLLALPGAPAAAQGGTAFVGPERLFTVIVPHGWRARVDPSPEGPITWLTDGTAYVTVMGGRVDVTRVAPRLRARFLEEGSQPYFRGWLDALRDLGRVQARPVARTRAFGYPALRLDVTYRRGDARDPRTGYALYVQGDRATYFITATAPARAFPAADRLVAALRLEGAR
ncbi:MAG TPA: hypothetical protein VHG93_22045 [Longimicrobium sp.]|nr:hypothetical protein [Longimicrobium sp.]